MQRKNEPASESDSFTITRVFDAPRELMFQVWTDPKHLGHWLAPKGFRVHYVKVEIKSGGQALYYMTAPDGSKMWGKAIYQEISAPSRIVYLQYFSDANGGVTRHPMSPTWPLEMRTTVSLEAQGTKTKLTLVWTPINATDEEIATFRQGKDGMSQGWGGTFEQLESYLGEVKNG